MRCLGACAAAAATTVPAACAPLLRYSAPRVESGRIAVPAAQLARLRTPGDALQVRAPGMRMPVVLRRLAAGYVAMVPACTHRGCQLVVQPSGLSCPCHGSTFGRDGAVLTGPATQPLLRVPTAKRTDGGLDLMVHA